MTSRPMQDLQTISDLLDQEWDPIGVYEGPRDEHFPPGEYTLYASWIFQTLRKGGGKADVVELMRQARESMGLGPPRKLWTTSSQMRSSSGGGRGKRTDMPRIVRTCRDPGHRSGLPMARSPNGSPTP